MSRSMVENQDATWLYLRALIAKPLRVADPRSSPRGQIKTLPRIPSNCFRQRNVLGILRERRRKQNDA